MSVTAFGSTYPKARKVHVCYLCNDDIDRGTKYHRWACLGDGTAITMKTHVACSDYASAHIDEWTDEGVDFNAVESDVRERIQAWNGGELVGVDNEAVVKIVTAFPDLSRLVSRVAAEIRADTDLPTEPK